MGIRALGYFLSSDLATDPTGLMDQFRQALFRLGAFGFENWYCSVFPMCDSSRQKEADIRVICFIDSPEMIVSRNGLCLVGDSNFFNLMQDLGFQRRPETFRIEGYMAQLGDFKIRYGIATSKDRTDKTCGVLLDLEYLPVQLLNADFSALFSSIYKMISKDPLRYEFPQKEPGQEYDTLHLGQQYAKVIQAMTPT
jgi:hypothetical protein